MRKSGHRAGSRMVGAVGILIVVSLFAGFLYLRAWPPIMVVMSSSMEPYIDTGGIVLMKRIEDAPKVGDIVTVQVPAAARADGYPEEILHRVIEITDDGLVRTQGDNLDKADPFAVPVSTVTKRVITVIPGAGELVAFVFSPYGLLWLAAGVFLFVIMPFRDGQRELKVAIAEYGYHLKSHTEILQAMSLASQDLAASTEQLRQTVASGSNGASQDPTQVPTKMNGGVSNNPPEPPPDPDREDTSAASNETKADAEPYGAEPTREKGKDGRSGPGRHRRPSRRYRRSANR